MISVEEAQSRILADVAPLGHETVSLASAVGRVLAKDVVARLTQPPAALSAMDGYAVRAADVETVPCALDVVGEAPAGRAFPGTVEAGQAVRIFTGGPLPDGADAIVIQEDTTRDGDRVTVRETVSAGRYVRPAGLDFTAGTVGVQAGRRLTPRDIGLAATMNVPWLQVFRRPRVAILATGDEIVMPGEPIGPSQIVSSNNWALAAFVQANGGEAIDLGIAPDDRKTLAAMAAGAHGADVLITTGGASVGEHDLIQDALGDIGLELGFWKIAMRPGKPLIFGRMGNTPMLGLPGNPVSSMVCALIFLSPLIDRMQGLGADNRLIRARLSSNLRENDRRQDYLRATLSRDPEGTLTATPFEKQDSSMFSRLTWADGLIVRPPHAPATATGDMVDVVPFADRHPVF